MDLGPCADTLWADLPDDPSQALAYHYGMLLGATDLRTEQGFHVGQRRRHARSLHGRGVVRGLAVERVGDELRVGAGLALDAHGRELVLQEAWCISLPAWWKANRQQPAFAAQANLDVVTLQLELRLRHRVCCERPVPAIGPGCQGGDASAVSSALQPSRLAESAELALVDASSLPPFVQGIPPAELPLFALLGVAGSLPAGDPDVDWALAQRAELAAAPAADRPALALRALDQGIALTRLALRDPSDDALPLARLATLVLKRQADDRFAVDQLTLDTLDRPSLLATGTLQRLLAALLASSPLVAAPVLPAPPPPPLPVPLPVPTPPAVAAPLPPFITAASMDAERLTLELAEPVHAGSAQPTAFAVAELDDTHGWRSFSVRHVDVEDGGRRLLLQLGHPARETRLRVVIDLAGRKPLLAQDGSELGARYRNALMWSL